MLKVDLHTHTCYSPDAVHGIRPMIRQAKRVGLDAIAITDHNRLLDKQTARILSKEFDILVLPGIEGGKITTEKHWIAIGISSVPHSSSIEKVITHIHDEGGIAIAPHPWTCKGYRSYPSLPFDAVESLNGTTPISNFFVNNQNKIPKVGGSDAHASFMLGYTWTEVNADASSPDDILEAVTKGFCRPGGRMIPHWCHPVFWGLLGLRYTCYGLSVAKRTFKSLKHDDPNPYAERNLNESTFNSHH